MSTTTALANILALRELAPNDYYYVVGKEGITQIQMMHVYHGEYSEHEFHIYKGEHHWRTVMKKAVAAFDFMPSGDKG